MSEGRGATGMGWEPVGKGKRDTGGKLKEMVLGRVGGSTAWIWRRLYPFRGDFHASLSFRFKGRRRQRWKLKSCCSGVAEWSFGSQVNDYKKEGERERRRKSAVREMPPSGQCFL